METPENTVVFFHRHCNDGSAAAWVLKKYFQERYKDKAAGSVRFKTVQYGEQPPEVNKNEHVIIADFSFPKELLEELSKKCLSVLVIDHHETAILDIGDSLPVVKNIHEYAMLKRNHQIDGTSRLGVLLDDSHSGAWLVHSMFGQDIPACQTPIALKVIDYLDRYDRFAHVDDEDADLVDSFNMWFGNERGSWNLLDELSSDEACFNVAMTVGHDLYKKQVKDADMCIRTHTCPVSFAGHEVPFVGAPSHLRNRVGQILSDDHPFVAIWNARYSHEERKNIIVVSLRGHPTKCKINLEEIARNHGGGGHKTAGAFSMDPHEFAIILGQVPEVDEIE